MTPTSNNADVPVAATRFQWSRPGLTAYSIVCVLALVALYLALSHRSTSSWSLVPIVVGLTGIVWRWSMAPMLVIVSSIPVLYLDRLSLFQGRGVFPNVPDLVLSMSVLAYSAAHYRLQSVVSRIFPPSTPVRVPPRDVGRGSRVDERLGESVHGDEIGILLIALPLLALLGQFMVNALPDRAGNLGFAPIFWRFMVFLWLAGTASYVGFIVYQCALRWVMTPDEARMILQDALWHETRGEQRRIARWTAWARLRQRRRKEKT